MIVILNLFCTINISIVSGLTLLHHCSKGFKNLSNVSASLYPLIFDLIIPDALQILCIRCIKCVMHTNT